MADSATFFHVHLVSDSTGETLSAILKATASRFVAARPLEHVASLVRSQKQMNQALARIESSPGLVLYTVADPQLRRHLEVKCAELQVPAVPVLDPILKSFGDYLGLEQTVQTGAQHSLDEDYFKRIAALDYTLAHDDGQMLWDLETADVVLVGVSRTSKTPTCMYLANRGIKAANVPLVPSSEVPAEVENLQQPLVIGLTASPARLSQIRSSRLKNIDAPEETDYSDADRIREEVIKAKRLFARKGWPTIDVTRRSVEETAASIISRLSAKRAGR
jgi:hypothetical protein